MSKYLVKIMSYIVWRCGRMSS